MREIMPTVLTLIYVLGDKKRIRKSSGGSVDEHGRQVSPLTHSKTEQARRLLAA